MKKVTRKISLDFTRKNNTRVLFASEADFNSREFVITLLDDGKPYPVSKNFIAIVNVRRSDEENRAYIGEITDEGYVKYIAKLWDLSVPGDVYFSVSLFDGEEERLTSTSFTVNVEKGLFIGDDISEEEAQYDIFSEMVNSLADIKGDEAKRVASENQRNSNESSRVAFERERSSAENKRRDAELVRENNERDRINDESARTSAEEERKIAEGSADSADKYYGGRALQEVLRCNSEENRETMETDRKKSEIERKKAEGSIYSGSPYYGGRQVQEFLREENEVIRKRQEEERVANENERIQITEMLKTALANLIALQEEYIARGAVI